MSRPDYLEITCNSCGRRAIYAANGLITHFMRMGYATDLASIGARLRCDKRQSGCGARGAVVRPVEWPPWKEDRPSMGDLLKGQQHQREADKQRKRH